MISKREAREIVDWVVSEIQKRSFPYTTDGKLDVRKITQGTITGGTSVSGGQIANDTIYDRHVNSAADIRGTKIRIATTSERGTVQLAVNMESASSKAVQANDTRLHDVTVSGSTQHDVRYYTKTQLDAGQLDNRYYTETEENAWRNSLASSVGAEMVGLSDPSGWFNLDNLQRALETLYLRPFTSLADVPDNYEGAAGMVVAVRATQDGLEFVVPSGGSGSSNFLDLTDTPNSYVGQHGKAVVVNDAEDGLDFVLISGATTSGSSGSFNGNRFFAFSPEFPNAVLYSDGATNSGTMSLEYENGHNCYDWTTLEDICQDYDILLRFIIPPDFDSIGSGVFMYNKSDSSVNTGVRIVEFLDTAGNNVITDTLVQNTAWSDDMWTISGGATWNVNQIATLHLKMQADKYYHSRIGEIRIPYSVREIATQTFSFVPEYEGFILDPYTGVNNGIMDGVFHDGHNAFRWYNQDSVVAVDYDIVVRFRIPPNFSAMGTTLYMWDKVSIVDSCGVRLVEFLDTAGANVITPLTKKNTVWTESTFPISPGTWTVGELATMRFRLFAERYEYAYLGEVRFTYTTD